MNGWERRPLCTCIDERKPSRDRIETRCQYLVIATWTLPKLFGMVEGPPIKTIDTGSVHRITSNQVVVDLSTEVGNSWKIVSKLGVINIGHFTMNCISVTYESYWRLGSKIHRSRRQRQTHSQGGDYDVVAMIRTDVCFKFGPVALNHHTSGLTGIEDLAGLETFGFPGEALSSLCALCALSQ